MSFLNHILHRKKLTNISLAPPIRLNIEVNMTFLLTVKVVNTVKYASPVV